MKHIIIFLLILTVFFCSKSFAQKGENVCLFLSQNWDARSIAMGGSVSAVADDSFSYYENPAGLGYSANDCEFSCMYQQGPAGSNLGYYGLLVAPVNITYATFNAGDIEVLETGEAPRNVNAQTDSLISIGGGTSLWQRFLGEKFFIGGNLKFVSSKLAQIYSANALLFDAGLMYRSLNDRLSIGIVDKNILKSSLKYYSMNEPLPSDVILGAALRKPFSKGNSLLIASDYSTSDKTCKIGIEHIFRDILALRAGYRSDVGSNMTAGIGIVINSFRFDYGINLFTLKELQGGHSMSLLWRFGTFNDFKFGSGSSEDKAKIYETKNMKKRADLWKQADEEVKSRKCSTLVCVDSYRKIPRIAGLIPDKGPAGSKVKIVGSDFADNGLVISFWRYNADIIEKSTSTLVFRVPYEANVSSIRGVNVRVHNNIGTSNNEIFLITPSKLPLLTMSDIVFVDENNDNVLSAGENAKLSFAVTNSTGAGIASDVSVQPEFVVKMPGIETNIVTIGNIEPGKSVPVEIPIKTDITLLDDESILALKVKGSNELNLSQKIIKLETRALREPKIELGNIEIDDKLYTNNPEKRSFGNGNFIMEAGEAVEVTAVLSNSGQGMTMKNSFLTITAANSSIKFIEDYSKVSFGNLDPGKSKKINFVIMLPNNFYAAGNETKFNLKLTDEQLQLTQDIPIILYKSKKYSK